MKIQTIKTRRFWPPSDNLKDLLKYSSSKIRENTILAISSKVISICEGSCIRVSDVKDKDQLIIQESDYYLPRDQTPGGWALHTLKNNLLIPTAGIDESNGDGFYILWPKNPALSAKKIWQTLSKQTGIKNFGILITDSHSIPLRRGVVGISLAHFGFNPLHDYRGENDLFGRALKMEQSNIPDSLAAAAVLAMGEGDEQTPLAIISDLKPKFFKSKKKAATFSSFEIPIDEDLFQPFLKSVLWKKNK